MGCDLVLLQGFELAFHVLCYFFFCRNVFYFGLLSTWPEGIFAMCCMFK